MALFQKVQRIFLDPPFDENIRYTAFSVYNTAAGYLTDVLPRSVAWLVHDLSQEKKPVDVRFNIAGSRHYEVYLLLGSTELPLAKGRGDPLPEIRQNRAGLACCEIAAQLKMRLGLEATVMGKDYLQQEQHYQKALRSGPIWYT